MPGSREWEQVICLEFIGIIWTPCLVFEVQENTEFHLSSSWKILCKSVWNCLLTSFHTHTDSVWFSILFFNNVFLPEAADFKPFYFRAIRLPTSWKNRKTLLSGTRLPLPAHHPYRLNSNHDLVWQCPNVSQMILPSEIQVHIEDKIICPYTFVLWPRILKPLPRIKRWNLPP